VFYSKRFCLLCFMMMCFAMPLTAAERLELEGAAIIGNQDLPQVLYIMPWKESDMDNMVVKPGMRFKDQLLKPLDRTIFKRQIRHYTSQESN
jgi:hypothetical protein